MPATTIPQSNCGGPASCKTTNASPYTATFNIAPESMADAFAGATGCARGSQKCSGTKPAFEPNPARARAKAASRTPLGKFLAFAAIAANELDPANDATFEMRCDENCGYE